MLLSDVTIVIPAYNAEKSIRSTLASAFAIHPATVLVINDGSTDSTAQIVSEYKNCRLVSQDNAGAAIARNRGIELVLTEFCILLDADDQLQYDGVIRSIEIAEHNPKAGAFAGAVSAVDKFGNATRMRIWSEGITLNSLLTRGISPAPPGVFLWKTSRLRDSMNLEINALVPRFAEDYELLLRAAYTMPIIQHDTPSLQYSLVGGRSSLNPFEDNECAEELRRYYSAAFGVKIRRRPESEIRALGHLRRAFEMPGRSNRNRRRMQYITVGLASPPLVMRLVLRRIRHSVSSAWASRTSRGS